MGCVDVSVTAWTAQWGADVYVWPADSGPLFDAVQAAPDDSVIRWPEGESRLRKDNPEDVYWWWDQQQAARGIPAPTILAWVTRGIPEWDGVTVR